MEKTKSFLEHIPPFPLDISVAAYYLMSTGTPYEAYLEGIAESNKDFEIVQKNLLKEAGNYTKTRYGIITSSLQHLIKAHKDFRDLLLLISLLDSQNIPRDLLEKYKNKSTIDNFIYNLKKHSFITKEELLSSGKYSTFSIHRSTQAIILAYLVRTLNLEKDRGFTNQVGSVLGQYIDEEIDKEDFLKIRNLINHIKFFLSHDTVLEESTQYEIRGALGNVYAYLYQFMNAKPLLEESLAKLNANSNENFSKISRILTSLGLVYRELGQYEKAKSSLQRSLLIYKNHLPKNYSGTAQALIRLGNVHRGVGEFEKAKVLYEQSLYLYNQHLPENKKGIAWALGSLGIIYKEFGQYEKARDYFEKALANFSENDAGYGWALAHLGGTFKSLGYIEIAKEHLNKSVQIYKKTHSTHDLGFGWALAHLGDVYLHLGDFEKAKGFLEQSLMIYKKNHLSERSTGFPWVLLHLGSTYMNLGNHEKARDFFAQSLQIYEEIFGKGHIKTARVLRSFGQNYFLEGHLEIAENYFYKALSIFQKNNHSDSYMILEDLAELFLKKSMIETKKGNAQQSQHFRNESVIHLKQALQLVKTHFPKDSPHIERIQTQINILEKQ